jgi:hypothetical protein
MQQQAAATIFLGGHMNDTISPTSFKFQERSTTRGSNMRIPLPINLQHNLSVGVKETPEQPNLKPFNNSELNLVTCQNAPKRFHGNLKRSVGRSAEPTDQLGGIPLEQPRQNGYGPYIMENKKNV